MESPIETFPIDDVTRYAVYYDEYSGNPLEEWDWAKDMGLEPVFESDRRNYSNLIRVADSADIIRHWLDQGKDAYDIVRWLNNHNIAAEVVRFVNSREVVPVIVYGKPVAQCWRTSHSPREWVSEVVQWFAGEVYIVATEKLVTYTEVDSLDPRTIERWEMDDAVGGVHFTNGYPTEAELAGLF